MPSKFAIGPGITSLGALRCTTGSIVLLPGTLATRKSSKSGSGALPTL